MAPPCNSFNCFNCFNCRCRNYCALGSWRMLRHGTHCAHPAGTAAPGSPLCACVLLCAALRLPQVAAFDDVGGDVAAAARSAGLRSLASTNVVVMVVDAAEALRTQKVGHHHLH